MEKVNKLKEINDNYQIIDIKINQKYDVTFSSVHIIQRNDNVNFLIWTYPKSIGCHSTTTGMGHIDYNTMIKVIVFTIDEFMGLKC